MSDDRRFRIVVVEDDASLLRTVTAYLEKLGHSVRGAERAELGWELLADDPPDVLISDIRLPDTSGLELLRRARERFPGLVSIMMTGYGSIAMAVEAMRIGAADFLAKPFALGQLASALEEAMKRPATTPGAREERPPAERREHVERIIGRSRAMHPVFDLIGKVARVDSTVLITGESGVGKELIVEALHHGHPSRGSGPLVPVHCGAIPENLIESELFGHMKGAFTGADRDRPGRFELASGGTLFLDEVGTMRPDTQVRLLRVLQSRTIQRVGGTRSTPVDVRVVAASNQDLRAQVERGEFREDLYYRLNVIPVFVPPLRDRRSDIPLLATHFAGKYASRNALPDKELSRDAMQLLLAHEWPGNVRELENVIEYATVISGLRARIEPADLPLERDALGERCDIPLQVTEDGLDFRSVVSELEKNLILQSLEVAQGNKARAAQLLDLKRTTFVEKLKRIRQGVPTL